jgi:ubiquinone/menaquinone biosynthesis C-methylase UbiE
MVLLCPDCRAPLTDLRCTACAVTFSEAGGIPLLFPGEQDPHRERQRQLYSHVADEYDDAIPSHVAGHYLRRRIALFQEWFPAGGAVLDVGCGTGTVAGQLQQCGYAVWGVDGSPEMLAVAQRKGVRGVAAPATLLPFADDSFDGAVTVATLHHVAAPDAVAATIQEMVRVIRPGGHAVLWDHNPNNPYWPIIMKRVPQDDGSERLVPMRELLAAASSAGSRPALATRLGFMPDFLPGSLLPVAASIERVLERLPLTRWVAAHNVVVLTK